MSQAATSLPPVAELLAALPTTGDEAVDEAMGQLRSLLSACEPSAGERDAQVLAAVHDALQRRLSVTAG